MGNMLSLLSHNKSESDSRHVLIGDMIENSVGTKYSNVEALSSPAKNTTRLLLSKLFFSTGGNGALQLQKA